MRATVYPGVFAAAALLVGCSAGSDPPSEGDLEEADLKLGRSEIVLQYDAPRKAELVKGHFFQASDFTGTAIVVKSAPTTIDIGSLLPESDLTAPNSLCYRGGMAGTKKILNTMLANTDGNGDHFLQPGSTIESIGAAKTLRVSYETVGEEGLRQHELSVARCL